MNTQTAKSKDDYSRNFKGLSFVLFYTADCCETLITANALQIVKGHCCVLEKLHLLVI